MNIITTKITRRRFLQTAGLGGAMLAAGLPTTVTWARPGPSAKKLRFIFYTDVHARTEWDTPRALQRASEAMNVQKADFMIAGGDLITDGFQSGAAKIKHRWDIYLKMHQGIPVPVYPVLGNHDLVAAIPEDGTNPSDDPRRIFRDIFGLHSTYYSFTACGYHFIILDSILISGGELKYQGTILPDQLEWLREDLSGVSKDMPIIIITHIPLVTAFYQLTYGTTGPAPKNRVIVNNRQVINLFNEHNLILVLQGHLHIKERVMLNGTTFITGGAICAKWWRGPWYDTEEGFSVITLDNNKVFWEYIDYDWIARRPISR